MPAKPPAKQPAKPPVNSAGPDGCHTHDDASLMSWVAESAAPSGCHNHDNMSRMSLEPGVPSLFHAPVPNEKLLATPAKPPANQPPKKDVFPTTVVEVTQTVGTKSTKDDNECAWFEVDNWGMLVETKDQPRPEGNKILICAPRWVGRNCRLVLLAAEPSHNHPPDDDMSCITTPTVLANQFPQLAICETNQDTGEEMPPRFKHIDDQIDEWGKQFKTYYLKAMCRKTPVPPN